MSVQPNSSRSVVYLQDACLQHRYIRSKDTSAAVELPGRLRAVKLGLAAAISRLEGLNVAAQPTGEDDLAIALGRMNLASELPTLRCRELLVPVIHSSASVAMSNHPAVQFVHDDVYLESLAGWARDSHDKIAKGVPEIPEHLSQTDLYLCPGSIDAIQGAIGTVCEAVDTVIRSTSYPSSSSSPNTNIQASRAFAAIRPPGHHCADDTPFGFCFVNNVIIGAAHAHLQHNIGRAVILDIDLHHGNGTQSLAWQINEETFLRTEDSQADPGLRLYYGSIHDVLSYPCEDGNVNMIQAASVSIHGPHGQHIENIHLEPYTSEEHFWEVLYKDRYSRLLSKAKDFIENTGSENDVIVFISCGFDACEHEYRSMSRHNRKVPASFYHRFTRDACAFADRYAQGRIVSVLEGGYSDRALTSGAMAHLSGLIDINALRGEIDECWWSKENLIKLEQATKKRRGAKDSPPTPSPSIAEAWLERATSLFSALDAGSAQYMTPSSPRSAIGVPSPPPPSSRTLRERRKPVGSSSTEPSPAPSPSRKLKPMDGNVKGGATAITKAKKGPNRQDDWKQTSSSSQDENGPDLGGDSPAPFSCMEGGPFIDPLPPKKLPRVILRLGPSPYPPPT